jgi:hypothetical protein
VQCSGEFFLRCASSPNLCTFRRRSKDTCLRIRAIRYAVTAMPIDGNEVLYKCIEMLSCATSREASILGLHPYMQQSEESVACSRLLTMPLLT